MWDSSFTDAGSRNARLLAAPSGDLAQLKLTPEEGFVLSRIDRSCTVAEILALSGLPEARTLTVLRDLKNKGAIRFEGETPAPSPRAAPPAPAAGKYGGFVFSPGELSEEAELDLERKKEILFVHANLAKLNHYELLGVRAIADKGEIKRAYFEQSKKFHPDRYYGKKLGSFKARLAEIFQRLTRAHEVLSDDARRAEYDKSDAVILHADDLLEIARRGKIQEADRERADERKRRLLRGKGFAKVTRSRELIGEAEKQIAEGNPGLALQTLQLAVELDPRGEEAKARLADLKKQMETKRAAAGVALGEQYEQAGNHAHALEQFKNAVAVDPNNARAHARWAGSILLTGGDFKEAKHHAQRAVELDGKNAEHHVTLAMCYQQLGLKKNARRELEIALEIEPGNAFAKGRLKQL